MGSEEVIPSPMEEDMEVGKGKNVGDVSEKSLDIKKKMKKSNKGKKGDDYEGEGGSDAPSTSVTSSVKPMERRKKRKMQDKERRRIQSEGKEKKPRPEVVTSEEDQGTSSSGSGMPVFHIGVFGDLASADALKRQAAAERLATELREVQKAYDEVENKELFHTGSQLEAEKNDGLENCAPSVRYAVRRLVRGVSSSRECARQGFALALTILVATNSKIRVDSLLKLIDDSLEVTSSMKGQDAKDCLLGRLFAYGSLAKSGRLNEDWTCTPHIKEFTNVLISLAPKRKYLQEPAVSVLLSLIDTLPKEAVLNHILEAPGVREWFDGAIEAGNPDALVLALKLREKIASESNIFGRLLPHPYSPSRLFTADHLASLVNCLQESAFCRPRVHGVWSLLVNILLPDTVLQDPNVASSLNSTKKHKKSRRSGSSDEDVAASLKNFCEVILEGALLTSSHDRKHLAFDILLLMLPRLPASCLPIVLSHKFVQCVVDVLRTKGSWLHKVATHFLKELSDWVGSDDVRRVFVIVALQKHSGGKFDCLTRTKSVKDLMAGFTTEAGCMLFVQTLTSMFVDEDHTTDEPEPSDESLTADDNAENGSVEHKESDGTSSSADNLKTWVVESLSGVLKYLSTLDPEEIFRVQKEVMKFLAVQGLFSASLGTEVTSFELQEKFTWPKAPISSAVCNMCLEQLQLLLSNAQKAGNPLSVVNGLERNDLGYYFMRFLGTLCTIPSVSLVRTLSDEDEKAFKKLQAAELRLSREERTCGLSADANKLHALRYLLIQLLLQLLLQPDEYSEAAAELVICCQKAFSVQDLLGSSGEDETDGDESPELMDVLVDTLLSLLPHSSAPLRSAVEQVFKYFCHDVTEDGLLRMVRVIKKDIKPARHKDADNEDDDEDEDDLLGIEEAEESDEADMAEARDKDNGQIGISKAADKNEAMDDDATDASDDDDDQSDESDDDMDDDAMFRMDSYLAKIFQEKKNQAGGDTAHAQLVLFKLRILSLLEIYLHENPGSSKVLTVYSNLVQAFVKPSATEGSEQLVHRLWGILQKKIFKAKDYPKGVDIQLSSLEPLLEKSLRLASKPFKKKKTNGNVPQTKKSFSWNRYKMVNTLGQQSTYWILKVIDGRRFSEAEIEKVLDIFKGALENYFNTKKCVLKSNFLKEIFKRRPWVGQHVFGTLLKNCSSAKYDYRRVEALELVSEILKSFIAESTPEESKKFLKGNLTKLSLLIKELATHMPEKQARRAEARKFCGKVFQLLSSHDLTKLFLKKLEPEAVTACESHLGEPFVALTKLEK